MTEAEALKYPEGTVFISDEFGEVVIKNGQLHFNWGAGIDIGESPMSEFTLKEPKEPTMYTYKQAIKFPVGTVFKYKTTDTLMCVASDHNLVYLQSKLNPGTLVDPKYWNQESACLFLYTPSKPKTIEDVCKEKGWTCDTDGFSKYHFHPSRKVFQGPSDTCPIKLAKIIEVFEEND